MIGFVGRVEPRKGPLDLVRAAPAIRRGAPGARVVVVGDDPYRSDPAYTSAVLGSPEIEHYPWSDNAPGLMRHLDVLVLPSYQEPFGTVLAEAMAVGTPVVATRVGGLPEVVRDGVTGRLVAPGRPDQLAAAVLDVLAHRRADGRRGRRARGALSRRPLRGAGGGPDRRMRVGFDSRPARTPEASDATPAACWRRCATTSRGDIVETHDPRRCEVFHSPWLEGALLRSPVPMVVTLHDLVPLKRPGEYLRSGLRFKLRYLAVQRATRVIVPTAAVADDADRAARRSRPSGSPSSRRPRRPRSGPGPPTRCDAVRERYSLPERYLLWVGGLRTPDPRKRVAALARAPRTLPLVLVGPAGRWARELTGVQLTGAVDDDELAAIYTGAHALVFPSDDEGFGLPPVEALACGTPVAASDVPALREVLGDRATLGRVDDLEGLVRAAESLTRPAPAPPAVDLERRRGIDLGGVCGRASGAGPAPPRRRDRSGSLARSQAERAAGRAARPEPAVAGAKLRPAGATRPGSRRADGARAAARGRGPAAS